MKTSQLAKSVASASDVIYDLAVCKVCLFISYSTPPTPTISTDEQHQLPLAKYYSKYIIYHTNQTLNTATH